MINKNKILLISLLILSPTLGLAQAQKYAFASEGYILSTLPETKQVEAQLETYKQQLDNRLETKVKEFQTKGTDFERNYADMTDLERADQQEELQIIQESILKFKRDAQSSLQDKQKELLEPVIDKVQKAIDEIAAENGYDYVIRAEALLFAKPIHDISDLVIKKLGVTPPPNKENKKSE